MTREEAIRTFAHELAINSNINDSCDTTAVEDACIQGIKWADSHPSIEFIDKAYDWWSKIYLMGEPDCYEDFKTYMEK